MCFARVCHHLARDPVCAIERSGAGGAERFGVSDTGSASSPKHAADARSATDARSASDPRSATDARSATKQWLHEPLADCTRWADGADWPGRTLSAEHEPDTLVPGGRAAHLAVAARAWCGPDAAELSRGAGPIPA